AGVMTVIVRFSCSPTSQEAQLGRRILTVTARRSPGASRTSGQTVPPRNSTGTGVPSGPLTDTRSMWPENPGNEMPASPLVGAATPTPGQASSAATAATATTSPRQTTVRNHLRNTTISVWPTLRRMADPEGGRVIPRELSLDEIAEFLRSQRIARLGCHADGVTYVVPLIYAYDNG